MRKFFKILKNVTVFVFFLTLQPIVANDSPYSPYSPHSPSSTYRLYSQYRYDNPARIHMVVYRGCEDSCIGFQRFFTSRNLPVRITVTDIDRDKEKLPNILESIRSERPDLVITWGTAVTRAIIGTKADYGSDSALGHIPALFMIVSDPVTADIIDGYEKSGRKYVTGVRNRVPEEDQFLSLFSYYKPKKLGIINSPAEINSTINTDKVKILSSEMNFELVNLKYKLYDGQPNPDDIPLMMDKLVEAGVDAIYVGSSSFNLQHAKVFTKAAMDRKLPVFSAYESMVKDNDALMSVGNSYVNVGKLAANQAKKILFDNIKAGELSIATLNRFSITINMRVAKELELYPPIQLINIAEIIN